MTALPSVESLYEMHRRRALAVVTRILGDSDEAEDVVQDVFARLFSKPFRFDGRAQSSTWLHRVLVNSSINRLRAQRRQNRLEVLPHETSDPEQETLSAEQQALLLEAIGRLSEQHRLVVTLRDLRGYAYPDIARLLRIPEGTVKSALNRGRSKLSQLLSNSPEGYSSPF
jgi:RNA polymerase sigma-70 factor, ECF subfamily